MKKRKKHHFFPHNFLKKPARIFKDLGCQFPLFLNRVLKFCFLFFVFCFLFLNLHSSFFPENERLSKAKREALNFPFDPRVHINLAKFYLEIGDLEKAEREFSLAKSLSSTDSSYLKTAEEALKKAKERPEKIRQEISFWEAVIKEKKDYRDAYLRLAVLNYQISQKKTAQKYLQKALEFDPNFEPAKKLEKQLQN